MGARRRQPEAPDEVRRAGNRRHDHLMPDHLREFDPEAWGASAEDAVGPPERPCAPAFYVAQRRWFAARAAWLLARDLPLSARERLTAHSAGLLQEDARVPARRDRRSPGA